VTNLTPEQLKAAILRGLKDVEDRFARNPNPTDGSIRAEKEARHDPGGSANAPGTGESEPMEPHPPIRHPRT
jgi:hypothetical protein